MTSATRFMRVIFLMSMTLPCHAGTTIEIRVTARVVHQCQATTEILANCSQETLRFQSTLPGSANIIASEGEPSIQFIGPQPVVEKIQNTLNILF